MEDSVALVLETNNLRRGSAGGAARALSRLLVHLRTEDGAFADLSELVITHDGIDPELRRSLERDAGRTITWVEVDPETIYYAAKNAGFARTTSAIVAFGDSDCWPAPGWLAALLAPFARPDVKVVAGRTRYRDDVLGRAVSLLDFLYVERPGRHGLRFTRNFYANNVAFRREVYERFPYDTGEGESFYRGHCQALGLRLDEAGVRIVFADDAVTVHRFPDQLRELALLRLYRGHDLRVLSPRIARHLGVPSGTAAATAGAWIGRQLIARRDLRRREPRPLLRFTIGAVALGVATLDGVGAILGPRTGAVPAGTLSYQSGRERLDPVNRRGRPAPGPTREAPRSSRSW